MTRRNSPERARHATNGARQGSNKGRELSTTENGATKATHCHEEVRR
jgi:hypothetical protein